MKGARLMDTTYNRLRLKIGLVICLLSVHAAAQNNTALVFTHAGIISMTKEEVLRDYSVVVRDGKITEVGPSATVTLPPGATVIDATGKFLIPALSDMHVHVEGDAWNIMYPKEKQFSRDEIRFEDILFLYIAYGITTVNIMSALHEHIPLRENIEQNKLIAPRLVLSRMIDGAGKAWPPPISTWVTGADEAKKAVLEMHHHGYDMVKVYSFLDKISYDTIIATARSLSMPVVGHIPLSTSPEYVVAAGQKMIAHSEEVMKFAKQYNAAEVDHYASLFAASDTWVTTTLILHRNLNALLRNSDEELTKPGTEYLHPMATGIWNYIYQNLYKPIPSKNREALIDGYKNFQRPFVYELNKRGGKLLIGTDALIPSTLPGISLHEELKELVDAGLTPFEALKIATTNTFDFLGERDRAGTIEQGMAANLLLLEKNPLEDITSTRTILGVMTQNRWISKKDIEIRLTTIRESYATIRKR